jgi:hypothetical protein
MTAEYKTYEEWQAEGMQVQLGQQSYMRINGKPMFAREQCEPIEYDDEEERTKDAHYGFDGW